MQFHSRSSSNFISLAPIISLSWLLIEDGDISNAPFFIFTLELLAPAYQATAAPKVVKEEIQPLLPVSSSTVTNSP